VRASAVLAAVFDDGGTAHVVLTRRAQHLRSHRGEIAFPGGGEEPGDADLWATALRESREEVGLAAEAVERLGELDHLQTITSRSFIVPFVGALAEAPDLRPDPAEVARVLLVPLAELLDDGVFREERWGVPPLDRPVWFFEIEGETIWGATAAMLRNLLALCVGVPVGSDGPWERGGGR
jgi:8-oxo-dGTP pyrophosphatase MutT (NUDIX family)